ncbi:MAG: fibronectin type III domain-containing protein [Chloroflexi bacterium]|nr:fibronectin type III domain-containing protein [Chloroflexota bacterium]
MRIAREDRVGINLRWTTIGIALAAITVLVVALVWFPGSARADATTPSNIGVLVTGETSATIVWQAVESARDYRVRYAPGDENYRGWKNLDWNKYPTGTSVDLTNLAAETEYKFQVRARFEGSPSSPWSVEQRFTTHAPEPTAEPAIERQHETGSVSITYHGNNAEPRARNLAVVRRDHKDVHFTWETWTDSDGDAFVGHYVLYREWRGANAGSILCLHMNIPASHTSYTDTSVASYHPGGNEATYEYRLYTRNGSLSNITTCDRDAWPTATNLEYVKIVVPVNHHEDVYAATNTGTVQHNDPQVPVITSLTAEKSSSRAQGNHIEVQWSAISYAPGYRIQYKKTSEADTEWKETYGYQIVEAADADEPWDNCTGSPAYSEDSSGERAMERGAGTRLADPASSICKRTNYPTDQVGHRWPAYWGADGHPTRYAPTKFKLQRVDANTQYDIRIAMCTELEDSTTRGLQVCAAVGDYSAKRTIRSAQ